MPYKRIDLPSGRTTFKSFWRENGVQRSKNFATEREARLFAARMVDTVERQGIGDPDRLTCAEWFTKFLDGLRARGELSPSTIGSYAKHLRRWTKLIGKVPLVGLTVGHVEDSLTLLLKGTAGHRPISASTARLTRTVLGTCLEAARRRKLRHDNPATDALPPATPKGQQRKAKTFTAEEARRYVAAAHSEKAASLFHGIAAAAVLLTSTGLRRGELLGLKWSDLDFETGMLAINRTVIANESGGTVIREGVAKTNGSLRPITLTPAAVEALRQHKVDQARLMLSLGRDFERHDLIFPWHDGRPMAPSVATHHCIRLCKIAGIKGRPPMHGARHFHATALLGAGVDLATVAQRLGHSSPATTLAIYSHSDSTKDKAAAERIGEILAALDK